MWSCQQYIFPTTDREMQVLFIHSSDFIALVQQLHGHTSPSIMLHLGRCVQAVEKIMANT